MKNQLLKLSLFYCSNSFAPEEISYCCSQIDNVAIEALSLPCSGKINLLYLLKAVETGADAVLLATCKMGDCKYLQGNFRAKKRTEAVNELISETGLGSEHIKFIAIDSTNKTESLINEIKSICKQLNTQSQLV